jgi:hypothetical protein
MGEWMDGWMDSDRRMKVVEVVCRLSFSLSPLPFQAAQGAHNRENASISIRGASSRRSWCPSSCPRSSARRSRACASRCVLNWNGRMGEASREGVDWTIELREVFTSFLPLQQQVRALRGVARAGRGGVGEFLKKAVTPPSDTALSNALDLLLHIGAWVCVSGKGKG